MCDENPGDCPFDGCLEVFGETAAASEPCESSFDDWPTPLKWSSLMYGIEPFGGRENGKEETYYRWRQEYGGLKGDQVKRLKELEAENARLRRAVSDLTLDKMILAEAARGNF
ncbi:hypothetical protein CHELA20_40226 [Hyphomicrobiales bacterium]|nr:hypothetical protein CHELA20_40226 [Hyphomicrobiales bacterium]CAH1687757.1 hypothetical protein CHELA41_40079 [Hyphomicrobiales bacterium]